MAQAEYRPVPSAAAAGAAAGRMPDADLASVSGSEADAGDDLAADPAVMEILRKYGGGGRRNGRGTSPKWY